VARRQQRDAPFFVWISPINTLRTAARGVLGRPENLPGPLLPFRTLMMRNRANAVHAVMRKAVLSDNAGRTPVMESALTTSINRHLSQNVHSW
jgi:hypothetical protein